MTKRTLENYIKSTDAKSGRTRRSFLRRFAAGAGAAAAVAVPAMAAEAEPRFGTDAFIGEITLFAGTFAPRGWAFCEGQSLPIAQNNALFSILGTNYGGDGKTTFKLPDLKKQSSRLGLKYIIAVQGVYPSRP